MYEGNVTMVGQGVVSFVSYLLTVTFMWLGYSEVDFKKKFSTCCPYETVVEGIRLICIDIVGYCKHDIILCVFWTTS